MRDNCEVVIVAGIGGSYLGARAVIEALSNSFTWLQEKKTAPVMIYAGHNIGEDYLYELTEFLKDKKFGVINISKSGTTTETALAFRLLKKQCEDQRGKEMAKKVIVAVTDAKKGAARVTADKEGYKSFIIPDNVGGRFSVLTPVGLLPIAVAGFDIEQLVNGAADMEKACGADVPFAENPAAIYAATRNELYKNGKKIEILVNFCPKLHYVSEWWKQLYGESEGKDNKGIFPAAVDFSTDLHSMGQWIREGERTIFETVISVDKVNHKLEVPSDEANLDGLNFLGRQARRRSKQNGRIGNPIGSRRRRSSQYAYRDSGTERIQHRTITLFLRKSLRYQRLSAGRKSVQPAGCRSIQKEHVCFTEQTRIRRRIKSYSRQDCKSPIKQVYNRKERYYRKYRSFLLYTDPSDQSSCLSEVLISNSYLAPSQLTGLEKR